MTITQSPRRSVVAVAAAIMLVLGLFGFVAGATTAGAADGTTTTVADSIPLHNATAEVGKDCPAGGAAYWHFVFAPNDGSAAFVTITLDLGSETVTFSGAQIIPNGSQTDNVFVAVPAGHTLTDLELAGSYATYSGEAPKLFNLSHVCEGVVPTTTTTEAPTTTTTEAPTTTSTTEAPTTTSTTEAPTTTSTSEAPASTSTTTDDSTTTTAGVTPSSESNGAAPDAEVLGTVQTPTTTQGQLPYTGSDTLTMVAGGLAILVGGLLLAGLARTRGRSAGQQ